MWFKMFIEKHNFIKRWLDKKDAEVPHYLSGKK